MMKNTDDNVWALAQLMSSYLSALANEFEERDTLH